jgi:hypothetical protein
MGHPTPGEPRGQGWEHNPKSKGNRELRETRFVRERAQFPENLLYRFLIRLGFSSPGIFLIKVSQ